MKVALNELRQEINALDERLQDLFQQRLMVVEAIARVKQEQALPIFDPQREQEILSQYEGLEREFFEKLLQLSRRFQSHMLLPRPIILIGMMGVGKTSVGQQLAVDLNWPFFDGDALLEERLQKPVADFFAAEGEAEFRRHESMLLQELSQSKPAEKFIFATGGGAVLRPMNREFLKEIGQVVLLTAQPETIYQRIRGQQSRPLLAGDLDIGKITRILDKRRTDYQSLGKFSIATDVKTVPEVAEAIIKLILKAN